MLKMFLKKGIYGLILFIGLFSFGELVKAETYEYRSTPNGRTPIYVGNVKLYASASVDCNMDNTNHAGKSIMVPNVTASVSSNNIYFNVKRSDINTVLRNNKCENVYSSLEANVDFLDFKPGMHYYSFNEYDVGSQQYNYSVLDNEYAKYGFTEVVSSPFALVGSSTGYDETWGGGYILYESDTLPEGYDWSTHYSRSQINPGGTVLVDFSSTHVVVNIIEDERIDLGENNVIISNEGVPEGGGGNAVLPTVDLNNFYGEYFENQKLKYSWTMYDKDGNPIEINVNTKLVIDESENEEKIYNLLNQDVKIDNLKNRIKILSFEHDGELNGTAHISVYVGDKFAPGSILTIFYYNPKNNELENMAVDDIVKNEDNRYTVLVDNDGYIAMDLTHCSEYILTDEEVAKPVAAEIEKKEKEKIETIGEKKAKGNEKDTVIYCILGAVGLAVLALVALFLKTATQKRKFVSVDIEETVEPVEETEEIVAEATEEVNEEPSEETKGDEE